VGKVGEGRVGGKVAMRMKNKRVTTLGVHKHEKLTLNLKQPQLAPERKLPQVVKDPTGVFLLCWSGRQKSQF